MTEKERNEKIDELLKHFASEKRSKKQAAFNAIYTVLGTIVVISITFIFSFILEIKSINQRQDRDLLEQRRVDKQKWKSIDYNFQVLNKDNDYLYKINDNNEYSQK
jgi:hypothetical protein